MSILSNFGIFLVLINCYIGGEICFFTKICIRNDNLIFYIPLKIVILFVIIIFGVVARD